MPRVGPIYFGFTEDDATSRGLKAIEDKLKSVNDKLEVLMALDKSTQDKIDALKAEMTDNFAGLSADIAALKAQVGSGATTAEINAALDELKTKADAFAALDAETTEDPPAPV